MNFSLPPMIARDPTTYAAHLRTAMQQLRPVPTRVQQGHKVHVCQDLCSSSHVFVRHDAVRKPLQPPYDGLFKMLQQTDKFFMLDINGKQDTVTLDRLKPAFLDPSIVETLPVTTPSVADRIPKAQHPAIVPPGQASATAPPAVTTYSGRQVKPPNVIELNSCVNSLGGSNVVTSSRCTLYGMSRVHINL